MQTPDVDTAEQGDEHQQPHPPQTAGVSEAESEDEAAMEQLGLTRRTHSVSAGDNKTHCSQRLTRKKTTHAQATKGEWKTGKRRMLR